MSAERMISWVEYNGVTNVVPACTNMMSVPAFLRHLCQPRVTDTKTKTDLWHWSPVALHAKRRAKANVLSVSCVVLDYDDGTTWESAEFLWSNWVGLMHTTPSHALPGKGERFRVILPLSRDVTPEEYKRVWRWSEAVSSKAIDKACKDPSRAWAMYYGKTLFGNNTAQKSTVFDAQELLSVEDILEACPPEEQPTLVDIPADLTREDKRAIDPVFRQSLGHKLGGVVNDEAVRLVTCPRCHRESVWWWVSPQRRAEAICNHRQSCGWSGPLAALLEESGSPTMFEQ